MNAQHDLTMNVLLAAYPTLVNEILAIQEREREEADKRTAEQAKLMILAHQSKLKMFGVDVAKLDLDAIASEFMA